MEARISPLIPDYEDPEFVIEDAEAPMETRIIHELLPPVSEWTVDLGCGYGRLSGILAKKSRNLVLVDYSMTGMRRARQRMLDEGLSAYFLLADVSHLPFRSGSIDTVAMFRVFHHFSDPETAIREIVRCIRSSGHLIFNYNSSDNAFMMLFWLRHKMKGGNRDQVIPFPLRSGTLRASPESAKRPIFFQTHRTLRKIMEKNDLVPSQKNYHSGILGKVKDKSSFLDRTAWTFQTSLVDKWPSRFFFPNNYVHCRKEGSIENTELHGLEDLLVCPVCAGLISIRNDRIECEKGHRFSIVNGIYDFRQPS